MLSNQQPAPTLYSPSLRKTAEALWGGNFWGRERINPELAPVRIRTATAR